MQPEIIFWWKEEEVLVHASKILATFEGTNGIIHVIDDVFLPVKK
jgi:uncharacterized surface protein with fasciclin (FAS1) repeats